MSVRRKAVKTMWHSFSWIFYFWLQLVPIPVSGIPKVALKMMAPILGFRYDVLCQVELSEIDDGLFFANHVEFISSVAKISPCEVKGWRYCDRSYPQQNGDCGCKNKTSIDKGRFLYIFFQVIEPITEDYMGAMFTCKLGAIQDIRTMEIVEFTRFPSRLHFACKNTTVILKWDFTPVQESIRTHFVATRITWTSSGRGSSHDETTLGIATYIEKDTWDFNNDKNARTMLISDESRLPQLALLNVQESDSKQNISIKVEFNTNIAPSRTRRAANLELEPNSSLLLGYLSAIFLEDLSSDLNDNLTSPTTAPTDVETATTDVETATTDLDSGSTIQTSTELRILTSTSPKPFDQKIPDPINYMVDTITLVVTEPPSPELLIVVKAYQSVTGNLVITCDVNHMYFPGEPPVNVSIWQDEKRLASRSGITTLHFSTDVVGNVISCGLEGHSLDCLMESDIRRQKVVFDLKDLSKHMIHVYSIDMLLSMYAFQCVIVIALIFWVVSLLLDHIMLVIRVRKKRALTELARAELPKYKRFSAWSIFSFGRKGS